MTPEIIIQWSIALMCVTFTLGLLTAIVGFALAIWKNIR